MLDKTFNTEEAAATLGIQVPTLYDWLAQSNAGTFVLRGQKVTIEYFQGGRRGQGRIRIEKSEITRLLDLMKVHPSSRPTRRPPTTKLLQRHITAKLGRPEN